MVLFGAMKALLFFTWIGLSAALTEYSPHHVELLIRDGLEAQFPGSGVLISLKHILTVATNIDGFAEWEITYGKKPFGRETLISKTAFTYPEYDFSKMYHNIGIIVLPKMLRITPATIPVGLPEAHSQTPTVGTFGLVSSHHAIFTDKKSLTLTYGPHQVVDISNCMDVYPKLENSTNIFCANQRQYKVCGGSQGTGLLENLYTTRTVSGILSMGEFWNKCASANYIVYVHIGPYVNWIRRSTSDI